MRVRILSYKQGSASARELAQSLSAALGQRVLRLRREGSRFRPRYDDVIINWGSSANPYQDRHLFNSPDAVNCASDKVRCLTAMHANGIAHPEFTTHERTAREWARDGNTVVCRTLTRANSGRGIVMARRPEEVVHAPLYTKYIKKQDEYRVHVFRGRVLDVQRKMRRRDVPDEDVNWQVRNHTNGFVFGREGVALPNHATALAVDAIRAVVLDFGAVDLIYNARQDQYYVLEINTAPGLTGTTLERYTEAFRDYVTSL